MKSKKKIEEFKQQLEAIATNEIRDSEGKLKTAEEKQTLIDAAVAKKTAEIYNYQGEPSPEMKQLTEADRAAKQAFDQTPGGDREKYEGAGNAYANAMGFPKYGAQVDDPRFREGYQKQKDLDNFTKDRQTDLENFTQSKQRELENFKLDRQKDLVQQEQNAMNFFLDKNKNATVENQKAFVDKAVAEKQAEITKLVEEKQNQTAKEIQDKQDQTAKAIDDKTKDLYRYQGEPSEAIKEKIAMDRGVKKIADSVVGGPLTEDEKLNVVVTENNLPFLRQMANGEMAKLGGQENRTSEITPTEEAPVPSTTDEETASTETTGDTTLPVVTPIGETNATEETLTTTTPPDTASLTPTGETNTTQTDELP